MIQPFQLIYIRNTLSHIADAIVIDKKIQRGDTVCQTAGDRGIFVILVEYMLQKRVLLCLIEPGAVSDAVEC